MPPSVALTFLYLDHPICFIPVFVLVLLAREHGASDQDECFNALTIAPDHVADGTSHISQASSLAFLRQTIPWAKLAQHLTCPPYMIEAVRPLWSPDVSNQGPLSVRFARIAIPETIYRYMPFRSDRVSQLLADGELFLPCPAMFNDPFDCSLDEPTRLTFIESAIGCFSTVPNDVLMFSHYADNHKGLCVGFDTRRLVGALTTRNAPLRADVRPVWYFPTMPRLSLVTQPALCATCKCDVWAYEKEFRVFIARGSSLVPSGIFEFDREAISEVICGCRATDDILAVCKSFTNDLPNCKQKKALRVPNKFGVQLHEIHKI